MYIYCRTNLDLCKCEKWPNELPEVPRVGDNIESAHEWALGCHLTLHVCSVTWVFEEDKWYPEIELSLPSRFQTITEFYEWYGRITRRGKAAFI